MHETAFRRVVLLLTTNVIKTKTWGTKIQGTSKMQAPGLKVLPVWQAVSETQQNRK